MNKPIIIVMNTVQYQSHGAADIAHRYDVDSGPLSIPAHMRIGKLTSDGHKITCYDQQVDEYACWIFDSIQEQNMDVMLALEEVFQKSITGGVIITTNCMPQPNITHADKLKEKILELAGDE